MGKKEQLKEEIGILKLKMTDQTISHETINTINQTIREKNLEIQEIENGEVLQSTDPFRSTDHSIKKISESSSNHIPVKPNNGSGL